MAKYKSKTLFPLGIDADLNTISGVSSPILSTDVANREYVDKNFIDKPVKRIDIEVNRTNTADYFLKKEDLGSILLVNLNYTGAQVRITDNQVFYGFVATEYLSGSSNTISDGSAFNFGTNDFTIEFWINGTWSPNLNGYTPIQLNSTTNPELSLYIDNSSNFFRTFFSPTKIIATSNSIFKTKWVHCALVRSGTNLKLYVDGVYSGAYTGLVSSANYNSITISGPCKITNLRITKRSLYNDNFTPSTYPLYKLANTTLLTYNKFNSYFQLSSNQIISSISAINFELILPRVNLYLPDDIDETNLKQETIIVNISDKSPIPYNPSPSIPVTYNGDLYPVATKLEKDFCLLTKDTININNNNEIQKFKSGDSFSLSVHLDGIDKIWSCFPLGSTSFEDHSVSDLALSSCVAINKDGSISSNKGYSVVVNKVGTGKYQILSEYFTSEQIKNSISFASLNGFTAAEGFPFIVEKGNQGEYPLTRLKMHKFSSENYFMCSAKDIIKFSTEPYSISFYINFSYYQIAGEYTNILSLSNGSLKIRISNIGKLNIYINGISKDITTLSSNITYKVIINRDSTKAINVKVSDDYDNYRTITTNIIDNRDYTDVDGNIIIGGGTNTYFNGGLSQLYITGYDGDLLENYEILTKVGTGKNNFRIVGLSNYSDYSFCDMRNDTCFQFTTVASQGGQHFGSSFTIEFYIRTTTNSTGLLLSSTTIGCPSIALSYGKIFYRDGVSKSELSFSAITDKINDGEWHHVAICRRSSQSGEIICFVDGSSTGYIYTDKINYDKFSVCLIGHPTKDYDFQADLRLFCIKFDELKYDLDSNLFATRDAIWSPDFYGNLKLPNESSVPMTSIRDICLFSGIVNTQDTNFNYNGYYEQGVYNSKLPLVKCDDLRSDNIISFNSVDYTYVDRTRTIQTNHSEYIEVDIKNIDGNGIDSNFSIFISSSNF